MPQTQERIDVSSNKHLSQIFAKKRVSPLEIESELQRLLANERERQESDVAKSFFNDIRSATHFIFCFYLPALDIAATRLDIAHSISHFLQKIFGLSARKF